MTRLVHFQTDFSKGVIGDRLQGQAKQEFYQSSLKSGTNMVVTSQGATTRRPGTIYRGTTLNNKYSRLIPFNFGQGESYMLEFGADGTDVSSYKIRIWQGGSLIQDGGSDLVVARTIYSEEELPDLRFAQSADVLYLTHRNHPPYTFSRYGATDWRFEKVTFTDGPYGAMNSNKHVRLEMRYEDSSDIESVELGYPYIDVAETTDNSFVIPDHGLVEGMWVKYKGTDSDGTAVTSPKYYATQAAYIAGTTSDFSATTPYFVTAVTPMSFKLALTQKGPPIYIVPKMKGIDSSSGVPLTNSDFVTFGEFGFYKQIIRKGKNVDLHLIGSDRDSIRTGHGDLAVGGTPMTWGVGTAFDGDYIRAGTGSVVTVTPDSPHSFGVNELVYLDFQGSPTNPPADGIYSVKTVSGTTSFTVTSEGTLTAIPSTPIAHWEVYAIGALVVKDNIYYTCIKDHLPLAENAPDTTVGKNFWEPIEINEGAGFNTTKDRGRHLRYNNLNNPQISWIHGELVEATTNSATRFKLKLKTDCLIPPADDQTDFAPKSPDWRLGAWNSTDGYPGVVGLYQQRLSFGGSTNYPNTLWFSKSGDFYNFAETATQGTASGEQSASGASLITDAVYDDNSVTLSIASNTVDNIRWFSIGRILSVGTSGGVFAVFGSNQNLTLTPSNFTILRMTGYPTEASTSAIQVDQNVLFVQENGRKLRNLDLARLDEDIFAIDTTQNADNLTKDQIKEVIYQDQPYNLVWCRLGDGRLLTMTYIPVQEIFAWTEHQLGGTLTGSDNPIVESIANIPLSTHDEVWVTVKRTINSATVRYIETLARFYDSQEIEQEDAIFVDSAKTVTGSGATSWAGYTHLEAENLRILADGTIVGDYLATAVPSTGTLTTATAFDKLTAGLAYNSYIQTLEAPFGPEKNIRLGNPKRIIKIIVKMLDTMGLKFGEDLDNLEELVFPRPSFGEAITFQSKTEVVTVSGGYENPYVYVAQDGPFPLTVLAIGQDIETNDF